MSLNRREALKSGAAGFLLGFLFRCRDGTLKEEAEVVDQLPSAVTIRSVPQRAFRAERLVIAGTVVGKRMVPERHFEECSQCEGLAEYGVDEDDEAGDAAYCEACDGLGGRYVETGVMIEEDVRVVPWTIESITIGKRSQLAAEGEAIPGDLFAAGAVDSFVNFDAASEGQEIEIVVRYTGDKPEGEVFTGALIGTAFGDDGIPRKSILPISSAQRVGA